MNSRKRAALALAPFELVAIGGVLFGALVHYGIDTVKEATAWVDAQWGDALNPEDEK